MFCGGVISVHLYMKELSLVSWNVKGVYNSISKRMIKDTVFELRGFLSVNGSKGFNDALSVDNFKWKVKDGCSALFWEDLRYGSSRLNQQFTRLFVLSKLNQFSVRDFNEVWFNPSTESDMLWNRDLRAWELEEVLKLNDI